MVARGEGMEGCVKKVKGNKRYRLAARKSTNHGGAMYVTENPASNMRIALHSGRWSLDLLW